MTLIKGRLRQKLKHVRDQASARLYDVGNGRVHYRLASTAFDRENAAVFAGVREHHRKTRAGTEVFELRRRIHMLEKGLTMRPRRSTFAAAYIEMVVSRLEGVVRAGVLEDEAAAWARDVLDAYFEATADSSHPSIAAARLKYDQIGLTSSLPYSGPSPLGVVKPAMTVQSLHELTRDRRSVRWYTDEPVDRAIVDRAMQIALESPTACNRVPYRFRIFDSPSDAQAIAAVAGGTTGYLHNLRSVVVVVGDLSAYLSERDRHLIYIDGSLAAMSFVLGLEAQGVASCCINWPDLREAERRMAGLLSLPKHERVVMLIAYGYADPTGLAPLSPKPPLAVARRFEGLSHD